MMTRAASRIATAIAALLATACPELDNSPLTAQEGIDYALRIVRSKGVPTEQEKEQTTAWLQEQAEAGKTLGIVIRPHDDSALGGARTGQMTNAITSGCVTDTTYTFIPEQSLLRWPAGPQYNYFQTMQTSGCDGVAYYRDSLIAIQWLARAHNDGDFWSVTLDVPTTPASSRIFFPSITFYEAYNGQSDCFVVDGSEPLCYVRTLDVTFYTVSQCNPKGTWTFQITDRNGFVDQRLVDMKERVPPNDVTLLNQNLYIRYDNYCRNRDPTILVNGRLKTEPCEIDTDGDDVPDSPNPDAVSWYMAEKACALAAAVMAANDHGATYDYLAINGDKTWFDHPGLLKTWRLAAESAGRLNISGEFSTTDQGLRDLICKYGPPMVRMPSPSGTHFGTAIGKTADGSDFLIGDPAGGVENQMSQWGHFTAVRIFRGVGSQIIPPPGAVSSGVFDMVFYSPVDAVLTAPSGARVGFDPRTGATYSEMFRSSYTRHQLDFHDVGEAPADADTNDVKNLQFQDGPAGAYTVDVIGTGNGKYTMEIRSVDRFGVEQSRSGPRDVPISTGEVHRYAINYQAGQPVTEAAVTRVVDVAFSSFVVTRDRLAERDGALTGFVFVATFALGAQSNGIAPASEPVSVTLSDAAGEVYSETIPAGAFVPLNNGSGYKYRGSAGNIVSMEIKNDGTMKISARRTTARAVDTASLRLKVKIGDDVGDAPVP